MKETILEILADACGEPTLSTCPDIDLLAQGLLDSLAFITLLERLDEELGIEIHPTQVPAHCWQTPGQIVALVEQAHREQQL